MTQELRKLAERLSPDRTTVLRIDAEQAGEAILELLDRVEKAEKDAERLDYLQQGVSVELLYDGLNPDFRIGGRWLATDSDLRTAIDSAMEASK